MYKFVYTKSSTNQKRNPGYKVCELKKWVQVFMYHYAHAIKLKIDVDSLSVQ